MVTRSDLICNTSTYLHYIIMKPSNILNRIIEMTTQLDKETFMNSIMIFLHLNF
jgi:hypothetical protein